MGDTFSWTLGLLETLRRGVVGGGSNKRLCEKLLEKRQKISLSLCHFGTVLSLSTTCFSGILSVNRNARVMSSLEYLRR